MKNKICLIALALLIGCSEHKEGVPAHGEMGVAGPAVSIQGNSVNGAGPVEPVSGGPNQLGVVVPTKTAVIARIESGLQGNAKSTSGNFARGVQQTLTNLPNASDVTKASGFDQVQLLAYAACSDLTTGGTPMMKSRYGVDPAATVATNQNALIAAGMTILDQHTAGIASQGSAASNLRTIFTTLVQAQSSSTSTVAFVAVCMAASTAGSSLLGI